MTLVSYVQNYQSTFLIGDLTAMRGTGTGSGYGFPRLMLVCTAIESIGMLLNSAGFSKNSSSNFDRGWRHLYPSLPYGKDFYKVVRNGVAHTFVMKGAIDLDYLTKTSPALVVKSTTARTVLHVNLWNLEEDVIRFVKNFAAAVGTAAGTGTVFGVPYADIEKCFIDMKADYLAEAAAVTSW